MSANDLQVRKQAGAEVGGTVPHGAPRVSLGMPVYNGEAFLSAALDALLAQTFADFELVISDNASTDATQAICEDYAARDRRIRYHRLERNLGAVPNFNRVFELSTAPLFKWSAHDDLCEPTYLEKAVALMDARPDVVWCHSLSSHIDARGHLLEDADALDVSYADRAQEGAAARFGAVLLSGDGCLDTYGVIRSEALKRTPLYMSAYGAEKVVIAELALMGPYAEIPETLFLARVSASGSGYLEGAAAQQAFIDTSRPPDAAATVRLRLLRAYLDAIARSAPNAREAWRARAMVARWVLQVGKWGRVAVQAATGAGLGGRNRKRVERADARAAAAKGGGTGRSAAS